MAAIISPALETLPEYTYQKASPGDYSLDYAELEARCPLDNGRHCQAPKHSAGQLDSLPLEILAEILAALDLRTLTDFRRVNRRAMDLVDSLHRYSAIVKHCPDVLRAALSIGATSYSCQTLYNTLTTAGCDACPNFGHYLYLITCKRVCLKCHTTQLNYLPVSVLYAGKQTGFSRKTLGKLPHILSLPGQYTPCRKLSRGRALFFDRRAVLAHAAGGSGVALDLRTQAGDRKTAEHRRYVAIISAPCISPSDQSADWGYFCTGCKNSASSSKLGFLTKYTKNDILKHIVQCGPSIAPDDRIDREDIASAGSILT